MTTQPTALRLADQLGARYSGFPTCDEAATELRRQHSEIEQLRVREAADLLEMSYLLAQRDELLEALKEWLSGAEAMGWNTIKARAAIGAAIARDP